MDPRLRRSMERDRLERITEQDLHKAEDFVGIMRVLYTSTLCVSAEHTPTCSQILPIMQKLEAHFKVADGEDPFSATVKRKVWDDLSKRYKCALMKFRQPSGHLWSISS
ncbi:unnamed protein product [Gadus morhua 'NCC']